MSCADWKKKKQQQQQQTKTKKEKEREQCVICELMMKGYKVDRVAFEIDRIVHQKVKSGVKIVNLVIFSF